MTGSGEAGMMEEWRRLAELEPNARGRGQYGGLALVFAQLAGRRPQCQRALEGWNMRVSEQVLEWQAEARLETQARNLLRLLELRFPGVVPPELIEEVRATTNLAVLERWFEVAATAPSLDAFRQQTRNGA